MTGKENIRINKVVKDFNIGMGTLVEFLKKKGFEIDATPNAKISPEAFDLVAKEFGKEQIIKEQSKKVAIKIKEITEPRCCFLSASKAMEWTAGSVCRGLTSSPVAR